MHLDIRGQARSVLDGTALVDVGVTTLVNVGIILDVCRSLLYTSMGVTALVDVGVTAVAPANLLLPQQLQCRGLPNMGNTCYINATLQCLLSGQSFCTQLRRQEETVREGPSALLISSLVGVLGLRTSSDRELKRAVLMELKHLVSLRNRRFEGNSQNDAHEFLLECLLGLRVRGRDLGDVATQCPVDTVLSFQLLQIISCRSCGLESRREDNVTYISLPMVAQGSVRSCLEHYFTASPVEFRCECGGQESDMRMQLHTLPKVLILQLVRFCPFTLNKTEDALHLDTELQVMPRAEGTAVSAPAQTGSGHCSAAHSPGKWPTRTDGGKYRLSAIVSHMGDTIQSGHYVADCREAGGQTWVHYNDEEVTPVTEEAVLEGRAKTAYMLFYERKVWPPNMITSTTITSITASHGHHHHGHHVNHHHRQPRPPPWPPC
ncbi:ubiquitin carboxyl-terminal hydrolase 37-like [Engraulis encrasicolus]|uniref:ubiquitin carboxyl-terminal hydrolase 37-like n=1 Tax=Engraulis encrasicolus TaxID=184585 RepID=UPI002FD78EEC